MPECADRQVRVFSSNGVFRHEVAAPLTAEQKQARQLDERKRQQEAAALAEQRQRDQAILLRYQNEHDIAAAQKREIAQLRERIAGDEGRIATAESQLETARGQAQPASGQPSAMLRSRIDMAKRAIQESRQNIARYEVDIAAVNRKYDKTLVRFRELVAGNATTLAPSAFREPDGAQAGGGVQRASAR